MAPVDHARTATRSAAACRSTPAAGCTTSSEEAARSPTVSRPTAGARWNELEVEGGSPWRLPGQRRGRASRPSPAITGQQDLVYKIDISTPQPKLIRRYVVGLGDDSRVGGVGFYGATGGHRFDFSSVGVFPDGRVALSFMDSKTKIPFPTLGHDATCAIEDQPDGSRRDGVAVQGGRPELAIEQDTTVAGS